MKLEQLDIYRLPMELGDKVWKVFETMKWEIKSSIGIQIVNSADSIAANIAEGYGRYHFRDSKKFYYYARGSAFETKTWIDKLYRRRLISESSYNEWNTIMNELIPKLNAFINKIGKNNN